MMLEVDHYLGLIGVTLEKREESGYQSHVIQRGRPEVEGQLSHRFEQLIHQGSGLLESGFGRICCQIADWSQDQPEPGQHLPDLVMKLTGQVAAFLLLNFEQPAGKRLESRRVLLQCLFRLSKLGDIQSCSDQADGRALLVQDCTSPVIQYTNAAVREGDSVINAEMAALTNRLVDQRADPIRIFRHESVQELLVGEVDFVRFQAE